MSQFEHYRFISDPGQSLLRVDKFITARIEGTSRHRVQQAITAGYVFANGTQVKANYLVKPNDIITIELPYVRRELEIIAEELPINIVYEDDHLLVVNKEAGMVVHPGHGNYSGTLLNALAHYLNLESITSNEQEEEEQESDDQENISSDGRMGVLVHRIDKDTSGLLLVAKNERAQLFLSKQFAERTVERKYRALVWGNVEQESGTIESYIGRDPNDRLKFKSFDNPNLGKAAITHYRVVERFGYTTYLECQLETGRTHQIRVHMDSIGHPLFNDERYGGDRVLKGVLYSKYKQFIHNSFQLLPTQALHAYSLSFIHPETKKELTFTSEPPQNFLEILERWRRFTSIE